MTTKTKARPKVRVTEADFEKLAAIGRASRSPMPGATLLLEELERFAIVSEQSERRSKFVRLGSQVTYRDLVLQRERTVRVGLPGEANVDENRISVLAPVGAALMGLSVGDVFRWLGPDEKPREIEVLQIED
ncbi:GreA/GreB family elongation factor [Phenylobacterium sp.]|uniref:GreA/GreB family elongation factor n=1 Tax=Phenylobacterium sp. TaxID=1871053 RepID=UPI002731AD4E|nr:GreA/GreB family elongation factor [Phenylobacterium sp.]MDP1601231.1 GreA/GreB family elongation factor [Phenylobacterium sp.]MDP3590758.1 GreA/GreB family elongation factor [Phenylobacterium sp.]